MRPYRIFVYDHTEELYEILRIMENQGWHHLGEAGEANKAYRSCASMCAEMTLRRQWYDYVKAPHPKTGFAPTVQVDGQYNQLDGGTDG